MKRRAHTLFECVECGYQSPKHYGRCPQCEAWGSLTEVLPQENFSASGAQRKGISAIPLEQVDSTRVNRQSTGIPELDRVLGDGYVPGSVILIGGEPGVGKSTLLLQICGKAGPRERPILYYSGEESDSQIKLRADRIGIPASGVHLLSMGDLEDLRDAASRLNPRILIVDSIQTLHSGGGATGTGSVAMMRQVTAALVETAKAVDMTVFIIGHINKEGQIAGPKTLEHMVDVVLYFQGELKSDLRILRSVKNRFGPVDELGVFRMSAGGLESVEDPSALFIHGRDNREPGVVIFPTLNGQRALLVEIQSLVSESPFTGNPRRISVGFDAYRTAMLISVIEKKLKIPFFQHDVFINVTGGFSLRDPAADLPVLGALLSSRLNLTSPQPRTMIGEVGLTGEIRPTAWIAPRIREAMQQGLGHFILPKSQSGIPEQPDMTIQSVENIYELYRLLRPAKSKH
ncbi:MAG: DNA repair protein RadA [Candidatus Aminicenantes bacterium]|nr:DNA repair protein RadA [Candidatus Aminicenantes bacterium]